MRQKRKWRDTLTACLGNPFFHERGVCGFCQILSTHYASLASLFFVSCTPLHNTRYGILIVPIVSKDENNSFKRFEKGIKTLFAEKNRFFDWETNWDTSFQVEAFNLEDIKEKCLKAVDKHPGFEWIFNI